jgi:TP901 family phage tail tape measure protein
MADKLVRVMVSADTANALRKFGELSVAADGVAAEGSASVDKMATKSGGILTKLGNQLGNWGLPFSGSLTSAGEKMDTAGSKASKLSSILPVMGIVAGVALAGIAAESLHMADEFDKATNSLAANAGITQTQAQKIGNAFLDTGGDVIYSGTQITTAYATVAAQLGTVQGKALSQAQAMQFSTAAMNVAEATGGSLSSSMSDLASVMQGYGIQVSGSADASNVLYNVQKLTGQGTDATATSLARLHSTLGALTPPLNQTGGLLLDLTTHGETGRQAMSVLSTALAGIVKPTAAVTKAQQEMGVSFINAKTGALDPLNQIIGTLHGQIQGMGNAQAIALLQSEGFGTSSAKMLGIVQAGSSVFDADVASVSKAGSAHTAAGKATNNLGDQFKIVKAQVVDLGTKLGEALMPILTKVLNVVAQGTKWLMEHKIVLAIVAGVIGGVLVAAFIAWAASATAAAAASIAAAAPVIAIVAGIALLVAGVVLLVNHWKEAWGFITGIAKDIWNAIDTYLVQPVEDVAQGIANVFKGVVGAVSGVIEGIVNVAKGIIDGIIDAINAVIGLIDDVQVHIHVGPVNMDWNGLQIPKIPLLDAGGTFTAPGIFGVGPAGVGETIIPAGANPGGGGDTYNITNNVTSNDPQSLVNQLVRYCQQHGAIPVTVRNAQRIGA